MGRGCEGGAVWGGAENDGRISHGILLDRYDMVLLVGRKRASRGLELLASEDGGAKRQGTRGQGLGQWFYDRSAGGSQSLRRWLMQLVLLKWLHDGFQW